MLIQPKDDMVPIAHYVTDVTENSLYCFKINLLNNGQCTKKKANIKINHYQVINNNNHLYQTETITLPINEPLSPSNASPWFEVALLVVINNSVSKFEIQLVEECDVSLVVIKSLTDFISGDLSESLTLLQAAKNKFVKINDGEYQLIHGIDDAINYLTTIQNLINQVSLPAITGKVTIKNKSEENRLRIGLIGDTTYYHMLDSYYDCTAINENNYFLIEANLFDILILQTRAMSLIKDYSSEAEEQTYLSNLARALHSTTLPIVELKSNNDCSEYDAVLIPRRNCSIIQSRLINECEICNFLPLTRSYDLKLSILVPTSADLFQTQPFLDTVSNLSNYNMLLTLSETTYKISERQVAELFKNKENIIIHNHLSINEYAELCQSTPYVLLPSASLRPIQDLNNLCAIAVMCGAIPIIFGNKLTSRLGQLITSVNCFSELYDYLVQQSTIQSREKAWLSLFRKFKLLQKTGECKSIINALVNKWDEVSTHPEYPLVELIAVSKRPENITNIINSFKCQSYPNVKLHVIYNLPQEQINKFQNIAVSYKHHPHIRITLMDQSFNIGGCLNYGIRTSQCDYWFKIDDDDYYGKYYIEDMINWYQTTNICTIGKPTSLVFQEGMKDILFLPHRANYSRKESWHVSGNSLSSKKITNKPYFSFLYRNSCDIHWLQTLLSLNYNFVCADLFNIIMYRGDIEQHSWKVSMNVICKNSATIFCDFDNKSLCDVE